MTDNYIKPLESDYIRKGAKAISTNAAESFQREAEAMQKAEQGISRVTVGALAAATSFDSRSGVGGILGSNYRLSWVQIAPDGAPTEDTMSILKSRMGYVSALSSQQGLHLIGDNYRGQPIAGGEEATASSPRMTASLPDKWVHYGDSLTHWGSTEALAALTGWEHINAGYASNLSFQVAMRAGGWAIRVKLAGGAIPATGNVAIEASSPSYLPQTDNYRHPVQIAGVNGYISRYGDSGAILFTRSSPGERVDAPGWQAVTLDPVDPDPKQTLGNVRGYSMIVAMGRNDLLRGGHIENVLMNIRKTIGANAATAPSVLVWSIAPWSREPLGTANREKLDSWNTAIAAAFPEYFCDPCAYMRTPAAFTDLGITPTPQDTQDMAAGLTPTTFRSDAAGHFSDQGNKAWANFMFAEMKKRGMYV
ncbi:SGNH/GDSL hydrolase family protein [Rothia nasimurium]|uniref:SGNH/GDSL hydrolase family protein n=1 Tax=Rothia nasimurium TaxID=85336 RepID=UPI001F35A23E|nr:SGNH/GDSL hydrolase family protein [Rothia nasimurium]